MQLFFTPRSPYVRKVRMTIIELGIQQKIEFTQVNLEAPPAELSQTNPLGKVPALVTDEGLAIFDSPLVCEYLDSLVPGSTLFPKSGTARWVALRRQALADGILDALTTRRHEARRPDGERSQSAMDKQQVKSDRGMKVLEAEADSLGSEVTIGHIAIASCLGYLDFRFAEEPWRAGHPRLARWFETFSKRAAVMETTPPAGGH